MWINAKETQPPSNTQLLVLKTYLDAPYTEFGYDDDKQFWTYPVVQVDNGMLGISGKLSWTKGGKVTHWQTIDPIPESWNK